MIGHPLLGSRTVTPPATKRIAETDFQLAAGLTEAKARAALEKADVAVFAFKILDLYREAAQHDTEGTAGRAWWPVLVSSEPCCEAVHRCCLAMGVILCEPSVLPLPTLVHVAARPSADMHLDVRLLGMAVELGERLCRPMQARWPLDVGRRQLGLSLDEPEAAAIGDALFVQRELTGDLLDFYDRYAPGELDRRSLHITQRMGSVMKPEHRTALSAARTRAGAHRPA